MTKVLGKGFDKIKESCALYDRPMSEYEINEVEIMILCKSCNRYLKLLNNKSQQLNLNGRDMNKFIAGFCKEPRYVQEIMDKFKFDSRARFKRKYLMSMLENSVLKMTILERPYSKKQKYFLQENILITS